MLSLLLSVCLISSSSIIIILIIISISAETAMSLLPTLRQVCAISSWDSSLHDSASLNRVTPANERIYMVVKVVVRLSHPASMELVLRKRVAINIYKKQGLTSLTNMLKNRIYGSVSGISVLYRGLGSGVREREKVCVCVGVCVCVCVAGHQHTQETRTHVTQHAEEQDLRLREWDKCSVQWTGIGCERERKCVFVWVGVCVCVAGHQHTQETRTHFTQQHAEEQDLRLREWDKCSVQWTGIGCERERERKCVCLCGWVCVGGCVWLAISIHKKQELTSLSNMLKIRICRFVS